MLYVYGIINSDEKLDFLEIKSGRRVQCITEEGLGMVVSPADPGDAKIMPRNIMAHNAVMEHLLENFTVLPVKFGTILKDESAVRELIIRYTDLFRRQLERFYGKVEMGVKVLWDIEKLQKEYRESGISEKSMPGKPCSGSLGQEFLFRKYLEKAPEMFIQRRASQIAPKIHRPMASVSEKARLSILRTPALMLSGAYLVQRRNTGVFREEYQRLKKSYSEYKFLISGPWPPYNFVNIVCLPGVEGDEDRFSV